METDDVLDPGCRVRRAAGATSEGASHRKPVSLRGRRGHARETAAPRAPCRARRRCRRRRTSIVLTRTRRSAVAMEEVRHGLVLYEVPQSSSESCPGNLAACIGSARSSCPAGRGRACWRPIGAQQFRQPPPYRILVINDDGVRAPGIAAVAQALQAIGTPIVVAPAENQTGKGHSIITTRDRCSART